MPNPRLKKKCEPRTHVVSFRLRPSEARALAADLDTNPAAGVNSLKQFARKLVLDYARGRLIYVQPLDRKLNADAGASLPVPALAGEIQDRRFLLALKRFLNTSENWYQLRLFMLRIGWPKPLLAQSQQASTDTARLAAAWRAIDSLIKKL